MPLKRAQGGAAVAPSASGAGHSAGRMADGAALGAAGLPSWGWGGRALMGAPTGMAGAQGHARARHGNGPHGPPR